jgi:hypothetical protein
MGGVCVESCEGNILIEQVGEMRNVYMWGFTIPTLHQTLAYYNVKFEMIR